MASQRRRHRHYIVSWDDLRRVRPVCAKSGFISAHRECASGKTAGTTIADGKISGLATDVFSVEGLARAPSHNFIVRGRFERATLALRRTSAMRSLQRMTLLVELLT